MKIFCRHVWKILDKTVGESEVDVMAKMLMAPEKTTADTSIFRRRLLVIMACEKCGKTKVIRGEV